MRMLLINKLENSFQIVTLQKMLILLLEGYAKKTRLTFYFFHSIFNTKIYAFTYLYTQRRHFENSKMVKRVYIAQKLTKIQGIM